MARELVWTGFMSLAGIVDSPGGVLVGHPPGGWGRSTPVVGGDGGRRAGRFPAKHTH